MNNNSDTVTPSTGHPILFQGRPDLKGHRYLNWLRCSTDQQTDTSPDGQKQVNDAFGSANQMYCVGDILAGGVSGSQTFNRSDVKELIDKAKETNATKIIVFELSRATRGGIRHGNVLEDELAKVGLDLISSTEAIPEGDTGDLVKSVKYYANQQQAKSISRSVTRGIGQAVTRGTRPASSRSPVGFDRLYFCSVDKQPRALIRWEGLVQKRLDPVTGAEVSCQTAEPHRKQGTKGKKREERSVFRGYKRQADEHCMLVPGTPEAVEFVRTIFRLYYIEGWGSWRVTRHASTLGILNRLGETQWRLTVIKRILTNPIYCGVEVRQRYQRGLYNIVGTDGPVPVNSNQYAFERDGRISVPQLERPREDWVLVDVPHLRDFLPNDVREAAMAHMMRLFDKDQVVSRIASRGKKRHKCEQNNFVLSKLLASKQTHFWMMGRTKKLTTGRSVRYYVANRAKSLGLNGAEGRYIQATPLEDAVVPAVMQLLGDHSWIVDRVKTAMSTFDQDSVAVMSRRGALEDERRQISKRLTRIHRTSEHLTDDELDVLVADDNARIVAIRQELDILVRQSESQPPTLEEAVAAVQARLQALPQNWRDLPNADVRQLLRAVISSLEIDLSSGEVTMSVRLPDKAIQPLKTAAGPVNYTSAWQCVVESPQSDGIKIGEFTCEYSKTIGFQSRTCCYTCRRSDRQAA